MKTQKIKEQSTHFTAPASAESNDIVDIADNEAERPKSAFFITPLGGDSSDIRRSTDGLIDAVIEPVLRRFNIRLIPPHKIKNPGNITRQIVRYILESDLVIANLTGLNANVMYELAIRHSKRKPVIVIAEKGTILPFDIAAERTIFYQNDMGGVVELMARLDETIIVALSEENPENPVYSGLESSIIQEQVKKENDTVQGYIIEKLEQLSETVSILRQALVQPQHSQSRIVKSQFLKTAYIPDNYYKFTLRFPTVLNSHDESSIGSLLFHSFDDVRELSFIIGPDSPVTKVYFLLPKHESYHDLLRELGQLYEFKWQIADEYNRIVAQG